MKHEALGRERSWRARLWRWASWMLLGLYVAFFIGVLFGTLDANKVMLPLIAVALVVTHFAERATWSEMERVMGRDPGASHRTVGRSRQLGMIAFDRDAFVAIERRGFTGRLARTTIRPSDEVTFEIGAAQRVVIRERVSGLRVALVPHRSPRSLSAFLRPRQEVSSADAAQLARSLTDAGWSVATSDANTMYALLRA